MEGNPHFRELLQRFCAEGVEFLIVGGYAVMKHGEPRFTKDLDVWVRRSAANAARVFCALAAFGAPLKSDGLSPADFESADLTYQIGIAPLRVDILTHIDGVEFAEAWDRRVQGEMAGVSVSFLSLDDLIRNKEAMNRPEDAAHLKALRARRGGSPGTGR